MKLVGSFSILMFFIISILSFVYMYVNDDDYSYISSSRFLELVEEFPRDNFDLMLQSWENFKDNVRAEGWQSDETFLNNIGNMLFSLGNSIVTMVSTFFTFIIAFIGYGFDLVIWFISIPFRLII